MITTTTKPTKLKAPSYPYIGKSKKTGMIVLFTAVGAGVVVDKANNHTYHTGQYSTAFSMSCFEPYNEPVTLQNS
jgi:hypothetical protein